MPNTYLKVPSVDELHYRQEWMKDSKTMSYNAGYDMELKGYDKATGIMSINEKCKNNNNHNIIEFESFKDQIMKNREENIDINLKFYQKYYI